MIKAASQPNTALVGTYSVVNKIVLTFNEYQSKYQCEILIHNILDSNQISCS